MSSIDFKLGIGGRVRSVGTASSVPKGGSSPGFAVYALLRPEIGAPRSIASQINKDDQSRLGKFAERR